MEANRETLPMPIPSHLSNTYKSKLDSKKVSSVFLSNSGIGLKWLLPIRLTFFPDLAQSHQLHFYVYALYKFFFGKRKRWKGGNYLVLHNHWSRGYHHWLSEVLAKILHLNDPPQTYDLVIPEDYPSFAFESLEKIPFKSIVKVPRDLQMYFDSVTLVENPHSGNFSPKDIQHLREYFRDAYQVNPQPSKGIYISRSKAPFRHVINEKEVIEWFEECNFLILHAEELSFEEQVTLFSNCQVLVSIHGAGLTNAVFMSPGTYMLEFYREITHSNDSMNPCFINLSKASFIHHEVLFCRMGNNPTNNPNNGNIYVDLEALEKKLNPHLSHE